MEKEGMIKIVALGVAILAIAVPIMISCVSAVMQDGPTEKYTIDAESESNYAMDFVEYAKNRGATRWEYTTTWFRYSYTLYKNSTVIESVTDVETNCRELGLLLAYVYKDGGAYVYPYNANIYLQDTDGTTASTLNLKIQSDGSNVEMYDYLDRLIKNVKLTHLYVRNTDGDYIMHDRHNNTSQEETEPIKYINDDDVQMFGNNPTDFYAVGEDVYFKEYSISEEYQYNITNIEYTYVESEDTPIRTMTGCTIKYQERRYADGWGEWTEHTDSSYMPYAVTPKVLSEKTPYVNNTLAIMLSIIPIVAFFGIGMYIYWRLSNGGGGE